MRHLCGVLESDDNKGAIEISICPKVSKEDRQNYVKIEEAAQRMHGKNKRFNLTHHLDSVVTRASPHVSETLGSRHVGGGSKRTIADFLDIGDKDEVNAKWCIIQCSSLPLLAWYDSSH